MSTLINSQLSSPRLCPPNVPASLGPVNTAANRFEQSDYGDHDQLKEKFTQFVGETFFGQMIKSMRSTVGKPAYFHGGQAEQAFQGQLDQKLAEHLTEASASKFAEPLFHRQFPRLADQTDVQPAPTSAALNQLQLLSRR